MTSQHRSLPENLAAAEKPSNAELLEILRKFIALFGKRIAFSGEFAL
jgi:hypothetical protein